MERLLKIAELRDLEQQVTDGEITYSKMVEIINQKHTDILNDYKYKIKGELFTKNESLEMMYNNTSKSFKTVIENIKDNNLSSFEIVELLNEICDNLEAQSMVVNLRDNLNNRK